LDSCPFLPVFAGFADFADFIVDIVQPNLYHGNILSRSGVLCDHWIINCEATVEV